MNQSSRGPWKRRLLAVGLAAFAGATTAGAEFWERVPFMEWSDGQVSRILTRSPWASTQVVSLPPRGASAAGPARHEITLLWVSALPVREAIVRRQAGRSKPLTAQQQAMLSVPPAYEVTIDHVPYPFQLSQIEAWLRRKSKPPIAAQRATTDKTPTGFALTIAFPRTDPIALEDGEVELAFKAERFGANIAFLRPFEFRKTFTLKDMRIGAALAL